MLVEKYFTKLKKLLKKVFHAGKKFSFKRRMTQVRGHLSFLALRAARSTGAKRETFMFEPHTFNLSHQLPDGSGKDRKTLIQGTVKFVPPGSGIPG